MKKILFFLPLLFLCFACHKEPEPEPLPLPEPKEFDITDYIWKMEYWATPQDTFYPFRDLTIDLPERIYPFRLIFFPNSQLDPYTVEDRFLLSTSVSEASGRYSYTTGYKGKLLLSKYYENDMTYGPYTPFNDTLLKYIPTINRYEVYRDSLFLFGDSCQFLLLKESKNEIQYPQKQVKGL